ncbi:RdgB/HAM1 family non-canonical purine NTP pyrophosphatase [secondary endosymbiont of Ctenarytaina eucalypti]|uniref:dITP/XTP pyrophosphatase n=1 Tax=secondary endosymbiont of Ctenarytaina eucalypti TaxID=1199245 RepID=J3TY18_9ENTR|nr:RdgB/HAM1 family non-canonical purine NTP pyrophosphatase [secondary endosymbiont of Ctenarytaina eucalypti]AFP85220.1 non-canonical purine NTP pyrophosphatase, rdgB/HAM1 family [secondary endosymbiont of Ctenarytaina eucalypti]
MQKVVLATNNADKVHELSQVLKDVGIEIVAQSALCVVSAEESGLTFIENALLKARHAAQITGLPAIADDSGLVVDALDGAPGIYSARYAGAAASDRQNIDKLLAEMASVSDERRGAKFYCALVYLRHANDPVPLVCHGMWAGKIGRHPAGNNGFGYDAVFFLNATGCTAAEISIKEKQKLSHRSQALFSLLDALKHA